MKKTLFFIFFSAFCIALSAQPFISTDFKDVKVKTRNATVCGSNDKVENFPSERPSRHVPQSLYNLFCIGETHYVQATHANARNTINWSPDGKHCAAVWTIGSAPTIDDGYGGNKIGWRGTGINYYDKAKASWGPKPSLKPFERIETGPVEGAESKSGAPGWGAHVYTEQGECVVSHAVANGGMVINYRETQGTGEWIQYILKGPELSNGQTGMICPSTYAVGNTIHLVCVTNCEEGATYLGYNMCPLYYRSTDGGKNWEDVRTFEGVMTELDMREMSADQYVLTARGNHVVLAYINGYAAYLESFNGGDTWERHLVYDTDWSWESTGVWVGPTMYATTIAATIGDDEKVHIAFSAQMRHREPNDAPDSLTYYPTLCGLYTWNDKQPIMTHNDLKLEYDYDTQTWISLGYDAVPNFMDAPEIFGFERFMWWGEFDPLTMLITNYNNVGYISHPRLIAEKGSVYLMYSAIIEQPMIHIADGKFTRGVFVTVSYDNGETYEQNRHTSWISYHPDLFYCDWSDYWGPYLNGSELVGSIDIVSISENGFPTMATTINDDMLVFTWLSDLFNFSDSFADDYTPWQTTPYSIIGFQLQAGSLSSYMRLPVYPYHPPAVHEKMLTANLKISPNPAGNIATIQVSTSTPYTLTITNMLGQVVQTIEGQQSQVELNISNYLSGIYIVNVKTAHAAVSKKLVVK